MSEFLLLAAVIAIAPIFFICFLGICLTFREDEEWDPPRIRAERTSSIPELNSNTHEEWDPRPMIRSLERASRIPDIPSDSHQETPTDAASSSRIPGQQPSQQSLRVNFPPEIILAPSQHIINQKCDRPPSYESLFPT